MASPRPTLETYKYQMPGEKEAPIEPLYIFDLSNNSRKEIKTARFKNQTHSLEYAPIKQKDKEKDDVAAVWLGDNSRFYLGRSSLYL